MLPEFGGVSCCSEQPNCQNKVIRSKNIEKIEFKYRKSMFFLYKRIIILYIVVTREVELNSKRYYWRK